MHNVFESSSQYISVYVLQLHFIATLLFIFSNDGLRPAPAVRSPRHCHYQHIHVLLSYPPTCSFPLYYLQHPNRDTTYSSRTLSPLFCSPSPSPPTSPLPLPLHLPCHPQPTHRPGHLQRTPAQMLVSWTLPAVDRVLLPPTCPPGTRLLGCHAASAHRRFCSLDPPHRTRV